MRGELLPAVVALRVLLDKLHQLGRLDLHILAHFPHDDDLQLQSLGMGLSPDKISRLQLDLVKTLNLLQQDGHHFLALPLTVDPGRALEPHAIAAVVDIVALEQLLLL